MEETRLLLGYNGIEYLVSQLQTLTSNTQNHKTEITPPVLGVNWGEIKGKITNQQDLIECLNTLKQELQELIANASIEENTSISELCYLKEQVDELLDALKTDIEEELNGYYLKSVVDDMLQNKANTQDLSQVAFSGDYNDLQNKPILPVNVSSFTNDMGYLTEHQDISGKQDVLIAGSNISIEGNVISENNTTRFSINDSNKNSQGKPDILSYSGNILSFKVGNGYDNLICTDGYNGGKIEKDRLENIDTSELEGTYNLFIPKEGNQPYLLKNTIFVQLEKPSDEPTSTIRTMTNYAEPTGVVSVEYYSNSDSSNVMTAYKLFASGNYQAFGYNSSADFGGTVTYTYQEDERPLPGTYQLKYTNSHSQKGYIGDVIVYFADGTNKKVRSGNTTADFNITFTAPANIIKLSVKICGRYYSQWGGGYNHYLGYLSIFKPAILDEGTMWVNNGVEPLEVFVRDENSQWQPFYDVLCGTVTVNSSHNITATTTLPFNYYSTVNMHNNSNNCHADIRTDLKQAQTDITSLKRTGTTTYTGLSKLYNTTGSNTDGTIRQDILTNLLSAKANSSDLSTVATSGDYDDLINKPTIPTVPTNISSFTNDAGYLTEHQDISGKANLTDLQNLQIQIGDNLNLQLVSGDEVGSLKPTIEPINTEITELKKSLNELSKYVKHYLVLTPEQEQQIQNSQIINETLSTSKTVTIENGTICDIVIPEVTSTTTINAPLENYTSLELTSPKGVTLNNTGENIVDLDIQAPENGSNPTITLKGNYNTINVENASIKVSEGSVNEINILENNEKATSISGILSEDVNINSQSDKIITITNSNEQDTVNLKLNAENSTVTLNGTYKSVESTVSDNTLIVGQNTHIKKLTVKKGNVIVKDRNINNRIDEIENETDYTVSRYETHATSMSEINSGMQVGGLTIVENDIEQSGSGIAFGILASGNVELDLNGKTVKGGRSNTGLMYIRGTSNVNIVGQGCLENIIGNYGIWVSSVNATVNIYGGSYKATTHCLYAEKGTINVYDGEFRITDEDKKFLLNCLDASYNNGTAHINVFGGKFYGFNPAESMSEINGPVSFVAEGYHVVASIEDGETVYTVVQD